MKKREGHEVLIHELKSDPDNFIAVMRSEKLSEIRLDDREYEVDDYIFLKQTEYTGEEMSRYAKDGVNAILNKPLIYTGRSHILKIIHRHSGIGMEKGYVALSFKVLD